MDPMTSLMTETNHEMGSAGTLDAGSNQESDINITCTSKMGSNQLIEPSDTCKPGPNQEIDAGNILDGRVNQEKEPITMLDTGSNQAIDPEKTSEVGSNQETDPPETMETGPNQESGPNGMFDAGSNQEVDPATILKVESGSASRTLGTDIKGLMELFSLQIQICVFTEKGVEVQITKVTNVLSVSCMCSKCKKGFPSPSKLKMHMKTHSQDDEEVSRSVGRRTLDKRRSRTSKFRGKRLHGQTNNTHGVDSSEVKKPTTRKRKRGTRKKKGVVREQGLAATGKRKKGDTHKAARSPDARADGDDGQSDHSSEDGEEGLEIDIAAVAEKCSKLGSTQVTRRKVFPKRSIGESSPILTCYHCGKNFSKPSLLKEHCSVHTGEKSHPCPVCGRQFRLNKYVTQHMRTHTGEKPHICGVCGKAFSKLSYLKCHAVGHTGERPHLCTMCGKTFSTLSNLRDHAGMHEDRSVMCRVCGKTFSHRGSLSRHVKTEHEESLEDHSCKDCGKIFKGARRLKKHSLIHNKPYSCTECAQKFSMKYLYLNHMRKHTGEKPFKCTQCGEAFRLRTSLMEHTKKQHEHDQDTKEETSQDQPVAQSSYVALLESPSIPDMNWGVTNLPAPIHPPIPNLWHLTEQVAAGNREQGGLGLESRRGEGVGITEVGNSDHRGRELQAQGEGIGGGSMVHMATRREGPAENGNLMSPNLYM